MIAYLHSQQLTPYLLDHPALEGEFAALTGSTPNAVVVGDAAERFTYDRLNAAFRLLLTGAPLLAIATNRYFKEADGLSLDAGPFVAALEYAANVKAAVFGKPAAAFLDLVLADLGTARGETLMIGDDVEGDVNGALAAGLQAILVRTGKFGPGDELRINAGGESAAHVWEAVAIALSPANHCVAAIPASLRLATASTETACRQSPPRDGPENGRRRVHWHSAGASHRPPQWSLP